MVQCLTQTRTALGCMWGFLLFFNPAFPHRFVCGQFNTFIASTVKEMTQELASRNLCDDAHFVVFLLCRRTSLWVARKPVWSDVSPVPWGVWVQSILLNIASSAIAPPFQLALLELRDHPT